MTLRRPKIAAKTGETPSIKTELFEWLETIALSLVGVVLIFTFLFRIVGIEGDAMLDTLQNGDHLIVFSFFYQPEVGDIVVISNPNKANQPFVRRIIAMGGQTVDISTQSGEVTVDGKTIDEPYINDLATLLPISSVAFPYTVPEGTVFVMGDNRINSIDSRSRSVGAIDERYILGKAIFRLYPFHRLGGIYNNPT